MKTYTFHSTLSVWEIEKRLRRFQHSPMEAGLTEVELISENQFYLRIHGGVYGEKDGAPTIRTVADTVFCGTIGQIETGSCITGHFSTSKQNNRSTGIATLIIGLLYALFMLHNRGKADIWFFVSLLPVLILYTAFYLSDNLILNAGQKKEIIRFIENHLLSP